MSITDLHEKEFRVLGADEEAKPGDIVITGSLGAPSPELLTESDAHWVRPKNQIVLRRINPS
jgi:hypothetical protein